MAMNEEVLQARARRAYEAGRLRWSLRLAPFVLLAAGAAYACGRPLGLTCALGAALLPLVVGLSFAGGSAGLAVIPGLAGGSAAMVLPLFLGTFGHLCFGDRCMTLCLPMCVLGGAIAGVVIGSAARHDRQFLVSALAVAGLTGALACTLAGLAGVGGMLLALLVAARLGEAVFQR